MTKEKQTQTDNQNQAESAAEEVKTEQVITPEEEFKNQLQRLQAEFDNYRKRNFEEQQQLRKIITSQIIEKFVPILDHFEMAISHECKDVNYAQGVQMIFAQLQNLLKIEGVEVIQTKEFNPLEHEATSVEKDQSKKNNIILKTQMKGYKIGNKIIRKAKVVVNQIEDEQKSDDKKNNNTN